MAQNFLEPPSYELHDVYWALRTDFSARLVYLQRDERITAHFLICFLALLIYSLLKKKLGDNYTCEEILATLKEMNFAIIEGQGFNASLQTFQTYRQAS